MNQILTGDCCQVLKAIKSESIQCVVTSPPYWALRDYGIEPVIWDSEKDCKHKWDEKILKGEARINEAIRGMDLSASPRKTNPEAFKKVEHEHAFCFYCNAWRGSLGLEPTPELYVKHIVSVFREIRRVLRSDGTIWLNLGDSYVGGGGYFPNAPSNQKGSIQSKGNIKLRNIKGNIKAVGILKSKNLVGIPWRVAFALQADGWYLRRDIIWDKKNPMPESVDDRCTTSHEYIFHLTKSAQYYYDADAIREAYTTPLNRYGGPTTKEVNTKGQKFAVLEREGRERRPDPNGRNRRSVWRMATIPYLEAHFATFPPELPKRCILAGTSAKGKCPKCGKPWKRVIENGSADHSGETQSQYSEKTRAGRLTKLRQAARKNGEEYVNERRTIGWDPGCKCNAGAPVPCIVLDPFSGSGTSGEVCAELNRHYIGIELNPEYAKLRSEERSILTMNLPV